MRHALIFIVALFVLLSIRASAEDKIAIDQIPGNLLDEVKTTSAGARIISAEKLANDSYLFELKRDGQTFHVNVGGGIARREIYEGDNISGFFAEMLKGRFPNARIVRVVVCADCGLQSSASVDLVDPKDNGRHIHVAMGLGGGPASGIWNITKQLAPGELPDAVTKSINAKYPGARITSASMDLSATGFLNSYDVTFRPATGKSRGISCSANGEISRDYENCPPSPNRRRPRLLRSGRGHGPAFDKENNAKTAAKATR